MKRALLALFLITSPAVAAEDSIPLFACVPGYSMTTSFDERGWYCEKNPIAITSPSLAPVADTVAVIANGPYVTVADMTAAACERTKTLLAEFYQNHKNAIVLCIPRGGE